MGGEAPPNMGRLGREAPQLGINSFCDRLLFFVVFHAFRNLYTPPKTPFYPTGPASLLVVLRGFPLHFIDTRA